MPCEALAGPCGLRPSLALRADIGGGGTKGCRTEARVLQHLAFVMFLYDKWSLVLKRPACPSDPHVSSAAATRYSHAPVMRKRTDLQCAKSAMQHCHL